MELVRSRGSDGALLDCLDMDAPIDSDRSCGRFFIADLSGPVLAFVVAMVLLLWCLDLGAGSGGGGT